MPITENPAFRGNSRVEIKLKPTMKDRHQRDGGLGQGFVYWFFLA